MPISLGHIARQLIARVHVLGHLGGTRRQAEVMASFTCLELLQQRVDLADGVRQCRIRLAAHGLDGRRCLR